MSLSLIPTCNLGRVLPNGKKYAEFINNALVVSAFHVRDVITRHASGPQEDSDTETDDEYEDDESDAAPASTSTSPSRRPSALTLARERWQLPPSPSCVPPLSPSSTPSTRKERKTTSRRQACRVKHEVIRAPNPGCPPKVIAQQRTEQSTPIPVDFQITSHPGVTSTGWMERREQESDFEPEACEYSFEEAQQIPGQQVVDWHGFILLYRIVFAIQIDLITENLAL
ncbi:hypothetical protein B0H14DRAFT_2589902 [Mycena olivaceomarginata]|nr:hypothetical protein B0H14DRAFT_2589902 [Mycena olivaceomarginata]